MRRGGALLGGRRAGRKTFAARSKSWRKRWREYSQLLEHFAFIGTEAAFDIFAVQIFFAFFGGHAAQFAELSQHFPAAFRSKVLPERNHLTRFLLLFRREPVKVI